MTLETALPTELQERFEQAIKDAISGVSQSKGGTIQEVDVHAGIGGVDEPVTRELQLITVNSLPNDRVLGVELYFSPVPVARTPIVPDVVKPDIDHDLDVPAESTAPTYLSELGGDYKRLSDAIVETLARYCDALEEEPSIAFTGDRSDPVCMEYLAEDWCLFTTHISYPEYIEYIYANGLRDQAQRLGLPH